MKIALHGRGKMGTAVDRIARERGHHIVAAFDEETPISREGLSGCDAVIDFSHAAAVDLLIEEVCSARVDLVIGTTGWGERIDELRSRCESAGIGVVHAANFSPGANITFALARRAGELFAKFEQYDAGIEERHHRAKKDAPSGTALRIGREVEEGSGGNLRPAIASSRAGSEFGLHTLFFDSPDDLVEISHRARGREGFARGAVIAAEMVHGKKGFFRFDEMMKL